MRASASSLLPEGDSKIPPTLQSASSGSILSEAAKRQSVPFFVRPDSALPFYVRPIPLFMSIWATMLITLAFHVSEASYPRWDIPLTLFVLSSASMLCGYGIVFAVCAPKKTVQHCNELCKLDVPMLRRCNFAIFLFASVIIIINYKLAGLPPGIGLTSSTDTLLYGEYGHLKQVLFPLLIACTINSFLDPSKLRKAFYCGFGTIFMLLYVTRGNVMMALFQVLVVATYRSKMSKRKLYLLFVATAAVALLAANVIGNVRTTQSSFLLYMQIKKALWDWPMTLLWFLAYFSVPLSNVCWIVKEFRFQHATLSFLYPLLPAFWLPTDPHLNFIFTHSAKIIDGVHTYLATYYMDLRYFGVVLINLIVGVSAALVARRGLSKNPLTSAIFLGCIAFIFFYDFFSFLQTFVLVAIQWNIQKRVLLWTQADGDHVQAAA